MKLDVSRPDLVVGVIGTGAMGRGIAQVAAAGGINVLMTDARPGAAAEARDFIGKMLERAAEKGQMTKEDAAASTGRITIVDSHKNMQPCHLVIEAIVENLDAKRALFAELEDIVTPDCIMVSNTSSMSVTTIGAKLKTPQRFAGFHFFNPVPLMKLLGDASYSIYLTHILSLALFVRMTAKLRLPGALSDPLMIVLCAAVGCAVYLLFEKPVARVLKPLTR